MFENLKKFEVADKTAWVDLPWLGERARVRVRFVGDSNAEYLNGVLKRAAGRKSPKDAASVMELSREDDRALFPRCAIVGWEGMPGEDGQDVEFSVSNAADLCRQLPAWMFDHLRDRAKSPRLFLQDQSEAMTKAAVEELAGN